MEKEIKDFTRKHQLIDFFWRTLKQKHLTPLWLKTNPSSVILKTEIVLESATKFLEKQNFYEENFKSKSNISKHEWQGILNLKIFKYIIIKEAGKGGAVVIMNTKHYHKIISDHLNDEKTNKMVESNCDTKVMKGLKKLFRNTKII